jgi:hypothetical protein
LRGSAGVIWRYGWRVMRPRDLGDVGLLAVILAAALGVAGCSGAQSRPTSAGPMSSSPVPAAGDVAHVFLRLDASGAGSVVLTGAIGDHGRAKTAQHEIAQAPYVVSNLEVSLTRGSLRLSETAALTRAPGLDLDRRNCSEGASRIVDLPIRSGTGAYASLHGAIPMTATFAVLWPRYPSGTHRGQCAVPVGPARNGTA